MQKILAFLILTLSFTVIAKSQNSYYMEFKMEVGSGKEGIKNISKTWHNANASRIEMDMNIPGMGVKKNVMLMNKNNPGVIITLDDAKKVTGIFTDGDLRRLLEKTSNLDGVTIKDATTSKPRTIPPELIAEEAIEMMEKHRINQLVVTDASGTLLGALNLHDLFAAKVI